MNRRDPIAILGVPFDNVTTPETLAIIAEMIASGQPHCAATANVDFLVQALEDVELRRILFDMHLVLADGMPIVWASRLLGNPLLERVTGSGLIPLLLGEAERRGWRVFFLGGTEQSVAMAAEKTRAKYPQLQLVGAYSPPFNRLLEMDHEDILRRIHAARPDILLVAFGCPKQEKWINMHYRSAGVPFSVGVGATIDFLAGTFKRAPLWMQKTGTEWIFRMLQEPRRLVRRYGKDLWVFGRVIWQQWWHLKRWKKSPAPATPSAVRADLPGVVIIKVPETLGAAEVQRLRAEWQPAVESNDVIFDLSATKMTDSTGMGLLIRLRKRSRELGHGLVLVSPGSQMQAALALMKLTDFFAVEASLPAARLRVKNETGGAQLSVQTQTETLVIRWQGDVTAETTPDLTTRTESQLQRVVAGQRVVIDLGGVAFVDSTGVGLMVRLRKYALRHHVSLAFDQPNANVLNVLRLLKIEEFLLAPPPS
jgi:N-acetylglucosaminyldiphosphoundecaprenol N-acetyl-beta-D-mannosaminyltransferase